MKMKVKKVVAFSEEGAELIKKALGAYISVSLAGNPFNDEVALAMKLYQTFDNICKVVK